MRTIGGFLPPIRRFGLAEQVETWKQSAGYSPESGHPLVFSLPEEKGIRRDQCRDQGLEASAVVAVGPVGGLEDGGVIEGFVAAHPKAEGMADKDLLHSLAGSESLDHLERVLVL